MYNRTLISLYFHSGIFKFKDYVKGVYIFLKLWYIDGNRNLTLLYYFILIYLTEQKIHLKFSS